MYGRALRLFAFTRCLLPAISLRSTAYKIIECCVILQFRVLLVKSFFAESEGEFLFSYEFLNLLLHIAHVFFSPEQLWKFGLNTYLDKLTDGVFF